MTSLEIRQTFLKFFEKSGHAIVPSSSLVPDDPSVLLTTAGMQQFKPYYTGEADPKKSIHPGLGRALGSFSAASAQKSFRTSDIDIVGDASHLTFFEMLGNFSFGGYFKKEAIEYAYDFIRHEMNLEISYVSIFKGSDGVPRDDESRALWQALGVSDIREEGMEDVFWGPTGAQGPCGPTTEIYCRNADGADIEVWNIVFNQFFFPGSREELLSGIEGKKLEPLKTPGVDTGMGLERLAMISQKTKNIFETDLFNQVIELLPKELDERAKRIIADHLRGSVFLLGDGVRPSNKDAGYILRRLLRRILAYEHLHKIPHHVFDAMIHDIVHEYGEFYKKLLEENTAIREEFAKERERFGETLKNGIKALQESMRKGVIDAKVAFGLYQSFGLPFEIIKEFGGKASATLKEPQFLEEFKKHQEISRVGQEKKFGGHGLLLDTGELKARDTAELEKVTRLHSATHLLQAALRAVLGDEVHQMGSDITVLRTRFDFSFSRKLNGEEIKKIEDFVNDAISRDLAVINEEMDYETAIKLEALHFFKEKYPPRVSVYSFVDKNGEVVSREFCGGPHVTHTQMIGTFTILKEEATSHGIRRIRARIVP